MISATSYARWSDPDLFDDINTFARRTGWLHTPMYDLTTYGPILIGVALLAGWWIARSRNDTRAVAAAVWAGAATLAALAVNQPIANTIAEQRPCNDRHDILVLVHCASDYGFPSDHAVLAGAAAAGLLIYTRRLGAFAAGFAVLLAFSRVYTGAHYPGDVLAGLVLGAAVAVLGWWLAARPLTAVVERIATTPLRPLVTAAPKQPTGTNT
ncbi:phosphatase PAP2 family protein [Nocardia tengchongensis]|uniref:phosphatase PAP2 family protein n=1 Tax=Nocardia tengchongensis TaxID=2055889 RepID=UPI00360BEE17